MRVQIAEKALFPSGKGEKGHRRSDADVHADHAVLERLADARRDALHALTQVPAHAAGAEEVAALIERIKQLASSEPRSAPPIGRAVANLMAALRGRAGAGELDRETVHQIADILDDAARKIERL